MNVKSKDHHIKDESGLIDQIIDHLQQHGFVRVVHFGRFHIVSMKGRKVFNRNTRSMVEVPEFKQIYFSPSKGLRDMLNVRRDVKSTHGSGSKDSRARARVSPPRASLSSRQGKKLSRAKK